MIYLSIILAVLESPTGQAIVAEVITALRGKGNQTAADTLQALADAAALRAMERAAIDAQLADK